MIKKVRKQWMLNNLMKPNWLKEEKISVDQDLKDVSQVELNKIK